MGHSHSHDAGTPTRAALAARRRANRLLTMILVPLGLLAVAGMIALWPSGQPGEITVADPYATAEGVSIDTASHTVTREGEVLDLTAKEYDLIELLMRNPRRVYSREDLMNLVWGYSYAGDYRTVDVHIRRLREKLEKTPAEPDYIMTKWGVGYYFKGESQPTI